jgi:hypothetical protein
VIQLRLRGNKGYEAKEAESEVKNVEDGIHGAYSAVLLLSPQTYPQVCHLIIYYY